MRSRSGKDLRELEWWCPPELEVKFCHSTFVDVNDRSLASADSNTGHFMYRFRDILMCFASATGPIAHTGDGEDTRPLCNTTKISSPRCGLPLGFVEGIEHIKRRMTGKRERQPFANAVINLGFERHDRWYVGNGDPD